jgi:hypothetical protein
VGALTTDMSVCLRCISQNKRRQLWTKLERTANAQFNTKLSERLVVQGSVLTTNAYLLGDLRSIHRTVITWVIRDAHNLDDSRAVLKRQINFPGTPFRPSSDL